MHLRTYTFYIEGMHCASCESLIEDACRSLEGVTHADAVLATRVLTVSGDLHEDSERVRELIEARVAPQGYHITNQARAHTRAWHEFIVAIPASIMIIIAFLLLQKVGLVNLISSDALNYGTAFLIGLIASVSTCLAVVGGLVLSVSAHSAKRGGQWRAQMGFHAGRLGGFFVLGGFIGWLGTFVQFNVTAIAVLNVAIAVIMLILGISLLDLIPSTSRFQLRMPKIVGRFITQSATNTHALAPILAGIATFFLPCGFTQSMQVYALTTGSIMTGAFTMLAFAFGTLPVLALLSFGSLEMAQTTWKGSFFKTAGIVVIALALFNVWNGFAGLGLLG